MKLRGREGREAQETVSRRPAAAKAAAAHGPRGSERRATQLPARPMVQRFPDSFTRAVFNFTRTFSGSSGFNESDCSQ
jgi:hypothetical protein